MVNVEGLLHVSALAAAVAIAYVGLDRLHWDDRGFEEHLRDTRTNVRNILLKFGIQGEVKESTASKEAFEALPAEIRKKLFVLCHVGGLGWSYGLRHSIYVQSCAPLLSYFQGRTDKRLIARLGMLALVAFLYLSAAATWHWERFPFPFWVFDDYTFPMEWTLPVFYGLSVVVLLWVCFTGAASQRLQQTMLNCDELYEEVQRGVDHLRTMVAALVPVPPSNGS